METAQGEGGCLNTAIESGRQDVAKSTKPNDRSSNPESINRQIQQFGKRNG
uniref:Uncharacterized protein n=1 Tax=viral metagenome TaxID=1070528 RepID=A0A6M3LNM3_9ZZZZ